MSSSTTDVRMAGPVVTHINNTIDLLNDYALGVSDISEFMYEVIENQCCIFGAKGDDKFLLYKADVSDITKDTDLYTPITESVECYSTARKLSQLAQESFRGFMSSFPGASSNALMPRFSLEHGTNASGIAHCHTLQLVGTLNVEGSRYKITFGELVDFQTMKDWGMKTQQAFQDARDWCDGLTKANASDRLAKDVERVKVICLDEKEKPAIASDDSLAMVDDDDSHSQVDDDLLLAMKLQAQWDQQDCLGGFDVFDQVKPYMSSSALESNVEEASQNCKNAMTLIKEKICSSSDYTDEDRQVFQNVHPHKIRIDFTKGSSAFGFDASRCGFRVFAGTVQKVNDDGTLMPGDNLEWFVPAFKHGDTLKSTDDLVEELETIILSTIQMHRNIREVKEDLLGVIFSTNPYQDRDFQEVFNGIHIFPYAGNFSGKSGNQDRWSYKVTFGSIYWMIPLVNESGVLKTSDEILEEIKPMAYFGPEINDLLVHWHKRNVFISTEFVTDKEIDDDGNETNKQVCTIGMFKVDELTCCPLGDLSTMREGNYKVRYELPDDIYTLKPNELIAGLQQNIHLFIDNMLEATGCSIEQEDPRNDVQTMIEALHNQTLRSELESQGAKLRWEILTNKGFPNTLKLYFDIEEQSKKGEVYAVFRNFLNEVDFNKRWSFKILEESSLCVQMSWQGDHTEKANELIQFIDESEISHLRDYGYTARQVVADGRNEAVKIDLHAFSKDKVEGARATLERLLAIACRNADEGADDEATVVEKLDSSVTSHGYSMLRPLTVSYALRTVNGPMAQMINFVRMHSGIPDLKISIRKKFGGASSIELEVKVPESQGKQGVTDGLERVLQEAAKAFSDKLWIFEENKRAPADTVKFSLELHGAGDTGFSSLFGDSSSFSSRRSTSLFGGTSPAFGGFAASRAFAPKPKPTQHDPGYGVEDLEGDDKLKEIFDFADDDL